MENLRFDNSDKEYDGMVDLATRQLAGRMTERAKATMEIYEYSYFTADFVGDFVYEFVTNYYNDYLVRPENIDEESFMLVFVNMAAENMRGIVDEAAQYFRIFRHLIDLYQESGCMRDILVDDPEYQKLVLTILADKFTEKVMKSNEAQ